MIIPNQTLLTQKSSSKPAANAGMQNVQILPSNNILIINQQCNTASVILLPHVPAILKASELPNVQLCPDQAVPSTSGIGLGTEYPKPEMNP